MIVRRVAVLSFHSSPLCEPGSGDAGGMTVYVRHLADALADLGVGTDVFTRATDPDDRTVSLRPGVRIIPIEAGPAAPVEKEELPRYVGPFVRGVRAFATSQRIRYDIVHSHYWQSGLAGAELARVWGAPLVHSHHTLGRVKNLYLAPGDVAEPEQRLEGEDQVISSAAALVASTDEEYRQLACMYGASHDRLKTLPPGVDHRLFRPLDRAEARQRLGIGSGPMLLYVGRIQKLKGIELAIRATEQLVHALDEQPTLVIVGGASGNGGAGEVDRLRSVIDALGVASHVRFEGPQPHTHLPWYYSASDVVVVCSHSESFGFAALEAQACARPVVGTPVGGLSHIVRSGGSGFLVDDRDPSVFAGKLKTILSDSHLAARFEAEALAGSRRFTWERTASTFLELYECLVEDITPDLCAC